jgi:hypothetical protein
MDIRMLLISLKFLFHHQHHLLHYHQHSIHQFLQQHRQQLKQKEMHPNREDEEKGTIVIEADTTMMNTLTPQPFDQTFNQTFTSTTTTHQLSIFILHSLT